MSDRQTDVWHAVLATCRAHPTPMALLFGTAGTLHYNSACAPLLGDLHPHAQGRNWDSGWPALHRTLAGKHLAGPAHGMLQVRSADGRMADVLVTSAPIPGEDGEAAAPMAALVVFERVTEPSGDAPADPTATIAARTGVSAGTGDPDDLADLSSLDVGTICSALGRLTVPGYAQWAIAWIRSTDRAGRPRLDRRDLPLHGRRQPAGTAALTDRLGVRQVIDTGAALVRRTPEGHGLATGSTLTIPLRDKRRVVGALTLGNPIVTDPSERLQDLADRAGVALANAMRFQIEYAISRDLQRLLAPRPLPSVRGVELAARLIAGSPGVTVGGDWYDACILPDGRLALTIGDVVGHGIRSAVEMTQLRTGLRNLALEGLSPAGVLAGADEFLRRTGEARFVTCLHAVYRPDTGQLDIANAGHLRPVHVPLDRRPRPVPIGVGLPLGGAAELARATNHAPVGTCRVTLDPGESMLLFTDGLLERRSRSVEQGLETLLSVLAQLIPDTTGSRPSSRGHPRRRHRHGARTGLNARQLCDLAVSSMTADRPGGRQRDTDDVAVLVIRRRQIR